MAGMHKAGLEEKCKESNLARVLSTLQEAHAHHVAGDLAWVGAAASAVGEDGSVQTLQELRVVFCWAQE